MGGPASLSKAAAPDSPYGVYSPSPSGRRACGIEGQPRTMSGRQPPTRHLSYFRAMGVVVPSTEL